MRGGEARPPQREPSAPVNVLHAPLRGGVREFRRARPCSSRVTPFTSTRWRTVGLSPGQKSSREAPHSGTSRRGLARYAPGRKPPAAAHSSNTRLGAWASMLMSTVPLLHGDHVVRPSYGPDWPARLQIHSGRPAAAAPGTAPCSSHGRSERPHSVSTWAIKRFGRDSNRPESTCSDRIKFFFFHSGKQLFWPP